MDGDGEQQAQRPRMTGAEIKARVERLCELWNQGWSAGRIAMELDMSRNSVIGVVYRERRRGRKLRMVESNSRSPTSRAARELAKREYRHSDERPVFGNAEAVKPPSAVALARVTKYDVVKRPVERPLPVPKLAHAEHEWVPLLKTALRSCRYTRDGQLFCNAPIAETGPMWCDEHREVIYAVRGK